MLSPNAYTVASCIPPFEGEDWPLYLYSYFDPELIETELLWFYGILSIAFMTVPLLLIPLLTFQLVYRKPSTGSFLAIGVGLLVYIAELTKVTSTADGYPNSYPFVTAIAAVCATGLLLLQPLLKQLARPAWFAIMVGLLTSVPSLTKAFAVSTPGLAITGLLLAAAILFSIYLKSHTPEATIIVNDIQQKD